jgi:hypothetical protein
VYLKYVKHNLVQCYPFSTKKGKYLIAIQTEIENSVGTFMQLLLGLNMPKLLIIFSSEEEIVRVNLTQVAELSYVPFHILRVMWDIVPL